MSFKDKLKTIKKGKTTPEKSQDFLSEDQQNISSFPGLEGLDDFDMDTNLINSQNKGKLPKNKANISQLKRNIMLLTILLVFLLGVLVYFFMQSSNDTVVNQTVEESTPAPVNPTIKKPVKNTEVHEPSTSEKDTDEQGSIVTSVEPLPIDSALETQKLEETIDMELPVNTVQAAEEMDMFKDEMQRLDEQEKELTNQISDQKKLSDLYEEQIKNLEQQLKEAE